MDYNDSLRYCYSIHFGYILLDLICAHKQLTDCVMYQWS